MIVMANVHRRLPAANQPLLGEKTLKPVRAQTIKIIPFAGFLHT
jgi:hypothetical protein